VSIQTRPGCDAFRFQGGEIGVLLQHGFTGCPASMRPMGEWLAGRGLTVVGPRLPGHGTSWEDLERTRWQDWEREAEAALQELAGRCPTVVALGQSMGGAMVLHLGAKHPEALKGVAVVNADVRRPNLLLAPVARLFARTAKGVGNDVKKPGVDEVAYDRVPLKAANELGKFYRTVARELPSMRLPLLVFSSNEDHVVKPSNSRFIMARAGTSRKRLVPLTNSYHVASLDYDAELIADEVLTFARSLAGEGAGPPG